MLHCPQQQPCTQPPLHKPGSTPRCLPAAAQKRASGPRVGTLVRGKLRGSRLLSRALEGRHSCPCSHRRCLHVAEREEWEGGRAGRKEGLLILRVCLRGSRSVCLVPVSRLRLFDVKLTCPFKHSCGLLTANFQLRTCCPSLPNNRCNHVNSIASHHCALLPRVPGRGQLLLNRPTRQHTPQPPTTAPMRQSQPCTAP